MSPSSRTGLVLGIFLPIAHVTIAFAQTTPAGGAGPAGGGGTAPAGGVANTSPGTSPGAGGAGAQSGAGTQTTTVQGPTSYQYFPGGVAPTAPGQTLGGGNTQFSSSKPITGNETDGFDYKYGSGGPGVMRGDPNGSFTLGG